MRLGVRTEFIAIMMLFETPFLSIDFIRYVLVDFMAKT